MIQAIRKLIDRAGEKYLGGHVSIGPVTLYGWNAMHIAAQVWCESTGAYICVHPTTRVFGGRWPWYLYVSRDATPGSAVIGFGPGFEYYDRERVRWRIQQAATDRGYREASADSGLS